MQWQIDLELMALISFGEAELRRRAFPSWSLGTSKAAGCVPLHRSPLRRSVFSFLMLDGALRDRGRSCSGRLIWI